MLPCGFSPAESHGLSELSGLAAADLINDALNPIGCLEDGADLASVVKKAEDGDAARILRQERLVLLLIAKIDSTQLGGAGCLEQEPGPPLGLVDPNFQ